MTETTPPRLCTWCGRSANIVAVATATKWDARRVATTRRLRRCALELTRDKGFAGWTMDDLAAVAEVSRRTVFNYFDSKIDLVLGPEHRPSEESLAAFVAGRPTGDLVDDMAVVAAETVQEKGSELDLIMLTRAVVLADPHLVALVHERFECNLSELVDIILQREGADYGRARAELAVRLLLTVFDTALLRIDPAEPRPFTDYLADATADARALFARTP